MEEIPDKTIAEGDHKSTDDSDEVSEVPNLDSENVSVLTKNMEEILHEKESVDMESVRHSDVISNPSESTANASLADTISTSVRPSINTRKKTQDFEGKTPKQVFAEEAPSVKTIPKETLTVEDMSDTTLVTTVKELQKNTKYLGLENLVFIHFLEQNDSSLLEGMETTLIKAEQRSARASMRASISSARRSTFTRFSRKGSSLLWHPLSTSTLGSTDTAMYYVDKEGPRINLNQKTDLILREMEKIKTMTEAVQEKHYKERHKLKAQLEEMAIRESELRETLELFENVFIDCTVERYLQNPNPAEKFSRFMEEWFKKSRLTVDKIRLRTSSLRVQYAKICNQLSQKESIGKNLQEVDFEQLHIENKNLIIKIEQRNKLLFELKKLTGKANLLLSQLKKTVLKKTQDLKQIQDDIAYREEQIIKFDQECEKVSLELDDVKSEYDQIKIRTETYQVPEILDYVKAKAELSVLKKNLKVWERRKQLKEGSLIGSIREMKHLTGLNTVQSSWFEDPSTNLQARGSLDSTFEFPFQRKLRLQRMQASNSRTRKISYYT